MTIKLRTTLSGPDGTLHPGVHTLAQGREKALVESGFAEFVKQSGQAETARGRTGENAAQQHIARRGK